MGDRWLPTMPLPVSDWMADPRVRLLSAEQRATLIDALAMSWMLDDGMDLPIDHLDDRTRAAFDRLWTGLSAARAEAAEKYRQKLVQTAAARAARHAKSALLQSPSQGRSNLPLQSVTSTSISSPSSEGEESRRVAASMEAFETFWLAYPPREGVRSGKQAARSAWSRHVAEADVEPLMAWVERMKRTSAWRRDEGKYIPHASTALNQRRWEDEPAPQPGKATGKDFSSWEKRA